MLVCVGLRAVGTGSAGLLSLGTWPGPEVLGDYSGPWSQLKSLVCSVVDEQGVTALCVTHRLEELRYADSASFMDGGRIQVSGSPESVGAHMRSLGARAY